MKLCYRLGYFKKSFVYLQCHTEAVFRDVLRKRWSENMLQIYRRTLIEITLRHECSLVNLLHIFRKPFPKNIYWRLLLYEVSSVVTDHLWRSYPAKETLFSNSNTRKRCDICSKLTVTTPERRHWHFDIYLFKANNRNFKSRCEIFSKLSIKMPEKKSMMPFRCLYC